MKCKENVDYGKYFYMVKRNTEYILKYDMVYLR